jgi:hypothetical protein
MKIVSGRYEDIKGRGDEIHELQSRKKFYIIE